MKPAAETADPEGGFGPEVTSLRVRRLSGDRAGEREDDFVATEDPLELRVEGRPLAVVMRTPGHDRELAAGFLLSEGIIKSARDLFDLTSCVPSQGSAVDAALAHPGGLELEKFSRHVLTSSSCGICGKASLESALKRRKPLHDDCRVAPSVLLSLPARLARSQPAFKRTGGLHACALFDLEGRLLAVREDVGRHNALDKLIGWALLEKRLPLAGTVVLLSGRVAFEMVQKAHAAGIPIVAAISAPTSLAVELAAAGGLTLVGFLRGKSMNVYTGEERLTPAPPGESQSPKGEKRKG